MNRSEIDKERTMLKSTMPSFLAAVGFLAVAACSPDRGVERPTPLFTESPVEYPLSLWNQDIEGMTLVKVLVSEAGTVDSVVVVESSGHEAFDSAAVAGAKKMGFDPALRKGAPVRVWARVPVHFSKKPGPPNDDLQPLLLEGAE